ncbi:MAG: Nif3-like dinuclear metal center hexameric protein, partial [Sedimentisphaerales bacterium]|nr:Nif3-like dinuclear metal center hexameric protein [Sedimentisphaerales bacterium]
MKAKEIARKVEERYPLSLAQGWDNVGFLVGDPQKNIENILLTIDITNAVVAEAKRLKTDLILSYHPVIWDGLKKVVSEGPTRVVHELIRSGIAVFSIHTALDVAVGGVNDGLAAMVGIVDGKPIGDYVAHPGGDRYKLIIFVPVDSLAKVSNAMFAAGAGAIGNYSHCSFNAEGTGTFLPREGARPAIGKKGTLEKVSETRFETVVPADKLEAVITAMHKAHPYETPAFDVFKIHNTETPLGLGRIGNLARPLRIPQIIKNIKAVIGAKAVGLVGDEKRLVKRAAVCAGTCGEIINLVIADKADLYLTGELKHHQALAAQEAGLTCICLSHTVS